MVKYLLLHVIRRSIEDTGDTIRVIIGLIIMYCKLAELSLNRTMCAGITAGTPVVHERNLPKQELGQQYQETNNYIRGVLQAPKPSSRISKFEELKMLLSKHCHHDDAKLLTVVMGQMLIDKNENFLDTTLEQLRDRDRFASSNYNYG